MKVRRQEISRFGSQTDACCLLPFAASRGHQGFGETPSDPKLWSLSRMWGLFTPW